MGKKPPHIALPRRSIRRKTITWALGSLVILANPSFSFVLVSAPVGHILTTLYLLRLCEAGTGDVTEMERILPPARAADPAILANPPHHHHQHNVNKYRQQILFCDNIFLDIIRLYYFYD